MHFNILTDPWLKVIDCNGFEKQLGLLDLFNTAHTLKTLENQTPVYLAEAVTILFLSTFISDAYALSGIDDKKELFRRGCFDEDVISAYIEKCRDEGVSFDIFDPSRPFMQVSTARIDEINNKVQKAAGTDGIKNRSVSTMSVAYKKGKEDVFYRSKTLEEVLAVYPDIVDSASLSQPFDLLRDTKLKYEDLQSMTIPEFIYTLLLDHFSMHPRGEGYRKSIRVNTDPPCVFIVRGDNLFQTIVMNCGYMPKNKYDTALPMWRRKRYEIYPKEIFENPALNSWMTYMFFPVRYIKSIEPEDGKHITKIMWGTLPFREFEGKEKEKSKKKDKYSWLGNTGTPDDLYDLWAKEDNNTLFLVNNLKTSNKKKDDQEKKKHPQEGYRMVNGIKPWLSLATFIGAQPVNDSRYVSAIPAKVIRDYPELFGRSRSGNQKQVKFDVYSLTCKTSANGSYNSQDKVGFSVPERILNDTEKRNALREVIDYVNKENSFLVKETVSLINNAKGYRSQEKKQDNNDESNQLDNQKKKEALAADYCFNYLEQMERLVIDDYTVGNFVTRIGDEKNEALPALLTEIKAEIREKAYQVYRAIPLKGNRIERVKLLSNMKNYDPDKSYKAVRKRKEKKSA